MKHVHLIGIGGTGISSIARVLLERGYVVSGSDRTLSQLALDLRDAGATVFEGHAAQNITGADVVVRSSAIPDDNPEVLAAFKSGIPVYKRSDFLKLLLQDQRVLAVAGSHGKTTTSTMLAWVLDQCGLQPGFILGGVSKNLATNARAGISDTFVIEADEYDYMFLGLDPSIILLTSVEYDHPDCFPTVETYRSAFASFVKRLKPGGTLVTNDDQPGAASMTAEVPATCRALTFGFSTGADYRAENILINPVGGMTFQFLTPDSKKPAAEISLQVPGEHNVRNALGVLSVAHLLGLPIAPAAEALSAYIGSGRRFDIVGESHGITIVDDYAHHPTKIKATLSAARARFGSRRLIAVWQPHTYSRTQALEQEFISSFSDADVVIITDVYAAREAKRPFSGAELAAKIPDRQAHYLPTLHQVEDFLMEQLLPGDVLIVLSAGDADQVCRDILFRLDERKG